MPEDPHRFPTEPEPIPPDADKSHVGIWVGSGCLGIVIVSCCLLSYWAQTFGFRWILNQGDEAKSVASAWVLTGALESIRSSCVDGVASEDAQSWFHSDVSVGARNSLCAIDEETIQQIVPSRDEADGQGMVVDTLASIGETEMATRFEMDPSLCYRYTADEFHITGCFELDGESGAIPYKIIDVTPTRPTSQGSRLKPTVIPPLPE